MSHSGGEPTRTPSPPAGSGVTSSERFAKQSGAAESVPPSPEAWYTQIRKMFAEGRREDAERELAALRKLYPDWAAKHVKAEDLR